MTFSDYRTMMIDEPEKMAEIKAKLETDINGVKLAIKELKKRKKGAEKDLDIINSLEAYGDCDETMFNFYSHDFGTKKGDDWTDFSGWHGGDKKHVNILEDIADNYICDYQDLDRYQTYDVHELLYGWDSDGGAIGQYLTDLFEDEDMAEMIINKKIRTVEDIPEDKVSNFKDFVEAYCTIKIGTLQHDW